MRTWVGSIGLSLTFLLLPGAAALGSGIDSVPGAENVEFVPTVVNLEYYAEEFRSAPRPGTQAPEFRGQAWYGTIRRRLEGDAFRERRGDIPFAVSYENGAPTLRRKRERGSSRRPGAPCV